MRKFILAASLCMLTSPVLSAVASAAPIVITAPTLPGGSIGGTTGPVTVVVAPTPPGTVGHNPPCCKTITPPPVTVTPPCCKTITPPPVTVTPPCCKKIPINKVK